jgi:chorismate synthase
MNTYGHLFKISIFGESHGKGVGITIDNCPAGLPLTVDDFVIDTTRRKGGLQKGTTPRQEDDLPIFLSGVFNNKTTGAPLTMFFENNNTRSTDYEKQREIPRPGHADFVANKKYGGHEDFRGGGHFSGRLTVCLVAAGVVAKKVLARQQINITSTITEISGIDNVDQGLQKAIDAKDSVGGIVDCTITNVPIGIGEPFFYSIEAAIAQLAFSIPAIKGIEFGTGFAAAKMYGSVHNDAIADTTGKTKTNHAGGIVGGISNGNDIYFKIAVKPTSSTPLTQNSLNWETGQTEDFSIKGRHDLCIALRVPVVAEAIAAVAIADFMLLQQKIERVL